MISGPLRGARWIPDSTVRKCWLGSFEPEEQRRFVAFVRPGMTVYDLGANVGFYTLLASRLVGPRGRVVAVEPLPRNVRYLERHVVANGAANVTVVNAAVSDVPGLGRFTDDASASENHLDDRGSIPVEMVTLEEIAKRHGPPDLIKMDVEGAEHLVITGGKSLLRRQRPTIFLSLHTETARLACAELCLELGYAIAPLVSDEALQLNPEWLLTPTDSAASRTPVRELVAALAARNAAQGIVPPA